MRILCVGVQSLVGANLLKGLPGQEVVCLEDEAMLYGAPDRIAGELSELKPEAIVMISDGVVAERDNLFEVLQRRSLVATQLVSAALNVGVPRLLNVESRAIYPASTPYMPVSLRDIGGGALEPHLEAEGFAALYASKLVEFATLSRPEVAYRTVYVSELYGAGGRNGETIEAIVADVRQALRTNSTPLAVPSDRPPYLDALHVGDVIDFIGHAVDRMADMSLRMNLGSGVARPTADFYAAVAKVLGYEGAIIPVPPRLNLPTRAKDLNIADQERFGWSPITDLEQGMRQALS